MLPNGIYYGCKLWSILKIKFLHFTKIPLSVFCPYMYLLLGACSKNPTGKSLSVTEDIQTDISVHELLRVIQSCIHKVWQSNLFRFVIPDIPLIHLLCFVLKSVIIPVCYFMFQNRFQVSVIFHVYIHYSYSDSNSDKFSFCRKC